MSDDDRLPTGAAAPAVERTIGSLVLLDAAWVVLATVGLLASSRLQLVDLLNQRLASSDAPFRVAAVFVPAVILAVGILVAIGGAFRRRSLLVAAATGALAPCAASVGVLSSSLFLDRDAAFADVGVAATLAAAVLSVVAIARWFLYHPVSIVHEESRPTTPLAIAFAGAAVATGGVITFHAVDDVGATTVQFAVQLAFALTVPVTILVASVARTHRAFLVGGAAALAQVVAVLAMRIDGFDGGGDVELTSLVAIWTGPIGLVLLVGCVAIAAASVRVHAVDAPVEDVIDGERWRWSLDD